MNTFLIILLLLVVGLLVWVNLQPLQFMKLIMFFGRKASGLVYKEIKVDDIVWPYLEGVPKAAAEGEGSKPVLVFVHGFAADKDSWSMYTRQFSKQYRMIVMDLPGHGESDKSLDRDYGIAAQTERLAKFLQALKIDRCQMIGNSMGGQITLNFALQYPQLLDSIVLIDNAGILMPEKTDVELAVDAGENPLEMKSPEDVVRQMALVMYKPMYIPGPFKRAMYERAQQDKPVLDKIFWTLVEQTESTAFNEHLAEIKVPTFIIWGRHDLIIDVSTVAVLESGIVGATSVIIEEAGHVPMLEKPKETAHHHHAFLATRTEA